MTIPVFFPRFIQVFHPKYDPTIVMYLIIIDDAWKAMKEVLKVEPNERFFNMVQAQVVGYMTEGKNPPASIASAIMNLADDIAAGREPVIRAGDYIALAEFARAKKIL